MENILKLFLLLFIFFSQLYAKGIKRREIAVVYEDRVTRISLYQHKRIHYLSLSDLSKILNAVTSFTLGGKAIINVGNRKIIFTPGSNRVKIHQMVHYLKNPVTFYRKEILIPVEFITLKHFWDITDSSFRISADKNYIFVSQKFNLYPPRYYLTHNNFKLVFEMTENLDWNIAERDGKIIVMFNGAKTANKHYRLYNRFVKEIELKSRSGFAECIIHPNNKVNFTEEFKKENLKLTLTLTLVETLQDTKLANRNFRIVIDPGHGGIDPGAIGPAGTQEKDINLKISQELMKIFKENGFDVYITRDDDVFIPLAERTNFANTKKADLFISIHCNAKKVGYGSGFEIYFLSDTATDADAASTAFLENEALKYELPSPEKTRLQEILWSMRKNVFMNESAEICGYISKQVSERIGIENKGVRQADFYVLRGAEMPAVLVECAYIDNPYEEILLNKESFQKQIVDAIFSGVVNYFENKAKR